MASIAQAAQQVSHVSQSFNADIPLAAWGAVIAALSFSTLEDLLQAYAVSKSLIQEVLMMLELRICCARCTTKHLDLSRRFGAERQPAEALPDICCCGNVHVVGRRAR